MNSPQERGVTGAVVAGGSSRRMGIDKRALPIDGVPMLRRTAAVVRSVASELIVACRSDSPPGPGILDGLDARLVFDSREDAGPLAGVEAALEAAANDLVLVVAGDMPWLVPAVLRLLIEEATTHPEAGVAALGTERGTEPLVAVYRRSVALPVASELLDRGRHRMHGLVEALPLRTVEPGQWRALDPDGRSAANVNELSDLDQAHSRAGRD